MIIIAGFGNPLLDITVKINSKHILQKYNLKDDDQSEIPDATMKSLLEDIKDLPMEYNPGGCVQNTLRIFQWLCGTSGMTYMIGVTGIDKNGEILKTLVENDGVQTRYGLNKELHTGLTVALINKENRSLVASIGAAKEITIDSLQKITNYDELLDTVDLIYMEGFFIPNREGCAKHILTFAKNKQKLFGFNISAPYICQENTSTIQYFTENCNILFGNLKEYESLIQSIGFQGKVVDFALYLNKTYVQECWKYRKIIVITNGSKKVTCIHSEGNVIHYQVPKLYAREIVDTTGAGDSFVAGFILGILKNLSPDICLKYGCWAAQQIIKQIGCKIPCYLPDIDINVKKL